MEVPPELQLPGSLEDALGAFPLLKPISPEVPASGLGRWGEVATGADPDDMDEDTVSVHDTASDAGRSVTDGEMTPTDPSPRPPTMALSALWPTQGNINPSLDLGEAATADLPLCASFCDFAQPAKSRPHAKQPWTRQEDTLILEGVGLFGHKWSKIASTLPCPRTD